MNIAQRFTLLVKGNLNRAFDALEDPEQSLHQLILDMEESLEDAKRAAARAMANEDRLRAQIARQRQDAGDWEQAARRAVAHGDEADAREALRRQELARRESEQLADRLAEQERDTAQVRDSVKRMRDQIADARSRLHLLQARLRQRDARRAIGKVLEGAASCDLYAEFERLGERVEREAAEENAYLRLDDELRGNDLRRRFEAAAVDDAVEARLAALRAAAEPPDPPTAGDAR